MRRFRSAKIIATLGPATSSPEVLEKLFLAGADIFRLNFSHGSIEDHRARVDAIRAIEAKHGRPIAILMDLQGPKLRVATFAKGPVMLKAGQSFRLDMDKTPGDVTRVGLPHKEVFAALAPKQDLLINDGKIRLRVVKCGKDFAETKVITGGEISDRKGLNVPDAVLPLAAMTPKDKIDLQNGLKLGVDWVGLSFVQRPKDIEDVRKIVKGRAGICAKLEKPAAIAHLDAIIKLADAVMVARGDLGVEMLPEEVPILQRRIVRACHKAGTPVVVATQMLESMISSPAPTRAEASDVATAVYDGADAVMLSAETAVGEYPILAVEMMHRIIKQVEADPLSRRFIDADRPAPEPDSSDAISAAARQSAQTLSASAIVTYTTSGTTSMRAARERPTVPILGLTSLMSTARKLALVWGVHPVHTADVRNFATMVEKAARIALSEGFAKNGQRLIVTAGVPFGTPGGTNVLRIVKVGGTRFEKD
ncbi:MAG: pyruvate kinase [Alphaproteobacteria bacterium]